MARLNQIRSLRSRIDEIDASGYQVHGFDVHNTLKKRLVGVYFACMHLMSILKRRKEKLSSATKQGRSPDKPSILFVSFIIEALKDGNIQKLYLFLLVCSIVMCGWL